jgi:hypothetical protein
MPALRLTVKLILRWADAHRERTGTWPHARSGPVAGAPGQTWGAVNRALARGSRGLPGGASLARLLGEKRGKRNQRQAPPLTAEQVLSWADAHFRRAGRWPTAASGPVAEAAGETWGAVASALYAGNRGLPGGETLGRFLRRHNRRLSRRRPAQRTTKVCCYRRGLGPDLTLAALDLCEAGARLELRAALARGQEVELTLESAACSRPLRLRAEVAWSLAASGGRHFAGLRFRRPLSYAELQALAGP